MDEVAERIARRLASRSSRRGFLKLLSGSALSAGLALTGSTQAARAGGCVSCGSGPCNPCVSPYASCNSMGKLCKSCQSGGGCPTGCSTSGEWWCCTNGCRQRCSECSCSVGCCHCFVRTNITCGQSCNCPLSPAEAA